MRLLSASATLSLLLAATVHAQDSSSSSAAEPSSSASTETATSSASSALSATSTSSASPVLVSATVSVSDACSKFIDTLNSDTDLASCTAPLLTATSAFSSANASADADVESALAEVCAARNGCSDSLVRAKLNDFSNACLSELSSADNEALLYMYDVLYVLNPLKAAICSKDTTSGDYCLLALSANTTSSASNSSSTSSSTFTSADNSTFSTFKQTNLPFLFLQPDADAATLCGACAKNVFAAWIEFEALTPYTVGLRNSPILGGQSSLWKAAKATCGDTWASNVAEQASVTPAGVAYYNDAPKLVASGALTLLAVLAASAML